MSQYKEGNVSVTNGSQTITGTGTDWSSEISVGDIFSVIGSNAWYSVGSVDSDTQLSLTESYVGATASGAEYVITRDFTPNLGLPFPSNQDVETSSIVARAIKEWDKLYVNGTIDGGTF